MNIKNDSYRAFDPMQKKAEYVCVRVQILIKKLRRDFVSRILAHKTEKRLQKNNKQQRKTIFVYHFPLLIHLCIS